MQKIFQFLGLGFLASLSLHVTAWGDMAGNGIECSVVMEKTRFDAREAFPGFKLVFANKGKKTVRLLDNFYPLNEDGPNIVIKIWEEERIYRGPDGKEWPIACYCPGYKIERGAESTRFITLKPGEKHEVVIRDAYLLLTYLQCLLNREKYQLEVSFMDGCADPGVRRKYVGRADFETVGE